MLPVSEMKQTALPEGMLASLVRPNGRTDGTDLLHLAHDWMLHMPSCLFSLYRCLQSLVNLSASFACFAINRDAAAAQSQQQSLHACVCVSLCVCPRGGGGGSHQWNLWVWGIAVRKVVHIPLGLSVPHQDDPVREYSVVLRSRTPDPHTKWVTYT